MYITVMVTEREIPAALRDGERVYYYRGKGDNKNRVSNQCTKTEPPLRRHEWMKSTHSEK